MAKQVGGQSYWSHGTSQGRGVVILLRKGVDITPKQYLADTEGRYVVLVYEHRSQMFTLVNLYAPNADQPAFFFDMFAQIQDLEMKRILIGDFNLALVPEVDRNSNMSKNNDKAAEVIKEFMEEALMCDIWRMRNPTVQQYTFRQKRDKKTKYIASRLDFALIDMSVNSWVQDIKIIPGFKSDHSVVLLEVNTFAIGRGAGLNI